MSVATRITGLISSAAIATVLMGAAPRIASAQSCQEVLAIAGIYAYQSANEWQEYGNAVSDIATLDLQLMIPMDEATLEELEWEREMAVIARDDALGSAEDDGLYSAYMYGLYYSNCV